MMYSFKIEISNSFIKELKKKPEPLKKKIWNCIEKLQEDPRRPGLNVHKILGDGDAWEAYVDKKHRITFRIIEDTYKMEHNCNHDIIKPDR